MDFHILTFVQHAFIRRIGVFCPRHSLDVNSIEAFRGSVFQKKKKLPFQPLNLTHLIKISLSLAACKHSNLCFCLIGFMWLMFNSGFKYASPEWTFPKRSVANSIPKVCHEWLSANTHRKWQLERRHEERDWLEVRWDISSPLSTPSWISISIAGMFLGGTGYRVLVGGVKRPGCQLQLASAAILFPTCEEVRLICMRLSPPSAHLSSNHPLIVKE